LLERYGAVFKGNDQSTVAAELAAEISNLRQAWRWAGETGQVMQIGQAMDTLFWLYESRCDCREGVPLFGYVAKCMVETNGPIPASASGLEERREITRARVLAYQGFFCLRQGLHLQSRELLHQSLEILRPLSEAGMLEARDARGYTLAFLGMVAAALGDYANGSLYLYEGLEIKRENQDRWGIAFCLRQLGLLAYYQGTYEDSYRLLSESLDVSRAIGNAWATAYSLDFLSTVAYAQGAYGESEKLLNEGLALSQNVGDRFTTAYGLNGLGLVRKALGDHSAAKQHLQHSVTIWREIGDQASLAQSLSILGEILLESGKKAEAQECFLEALTLARSASLVPITLDALLGIAKLRAKEGSHDLALSIVSHIKDHPSGTRVMKTSAEDLYSTLLQSSGGQFASVQMDLQPESFEQFVNDIMAR
jgi:tetratricopeptide (TPR) repeat protein